MRFRLLLSDSFGAARNAPLRFAFALSLVLTAAGCGGKAGPERVPVKGMVELDGKPLASGRIAFIPVPPLQGPAASGTISQGRFEIPGDRGALIGRHRIEIDGTPDPGFAIDDEKAYAAAHAARKGRALPPNPVPADYNRQSKLTAEVDRSGKNDFEFKLQSAGAKTASR